MATPEEIINNSQVGETFSDVGEIPGITTQSFFAPQTDPGAIPGITTQSFFAAQTDPGESPDTATDRLANADENQSAAETARLNRQAVDAKTPEVPQIDVPNPLHKYDSYTYSLSLYMMDFTKDYESLVDSPNQFQAPADKCLIASAGRGKRAAGFNTEFYFEDLEFTTVLGITPQNRNSNLISGSFKIIEPLGFTLINRLVDATKAIVDPSKSPRYEQQPYLLKIEFFGIEEGKMKPTPVEGDGPSGKFTTTKHIPIRIISMAAEVTEKGSEYKVEFVPFHHQALMAASVSIQTKFQLSGATIEEIFGTGNFEGNPYSITGAINKYYNDLAKQKTASAVANKIKFEIDPTIAKAKIYQLQKGSSNNNDIYYRKDGGSWWVEPNQKLDRLVDFFVRNSEYFTSQIGETTKANESLKIYKILPKVKQIGFDETTNSNVFETTYVITPFAVTSKQPGAIKPKVEGQVKKYSYIFTGKNIDILDFKIEFKMLYFQTFSAFQNKNAVMEGEGSLGSSEIAERENKQINNQEARKPITDPTFSSQMVAVAGSGGQTGIGGPKSEKSEIASHVALDLLNTPTGDLVNLELRIIGDPLFIKQDDLFYPPSVTGTLDLLTQNGSFIMDRGELYVLVEFNSPQDYDESTGLTDLVDNDYGYSKFSGVYRIISIKNSFSSGKFEQSLSMARVHQTVEIVEKAREQEKILDKQKNKDVLLPPKHLPVAIPQVTSAFASVLNAKTEGGADILKSVSDVASGVTDGIKNITSGRLSGLSFESFTSDEDLTYDGSDEIVRDRINAERASRGLVSLDGLQGGAE
jgi:hypothetical protein